MKAADLDGNDIIDVAEFRGAANIINQVFQLRISRLPSDSLTETAAVT